MGILDDSKRAKTNGFGFWRSKKFIIIAALLLVGGGAYAFWPNSNSSNSKAQTAPKEWTVRQDNIVISVEADGKVVAEDGVELSFNVNDNNLDVKEVYVKEGDEIKKGDKIATVETTDLELSLNSAWNSYQSTLADYNETMAGATADEKTDATDKITTAEISLEQARQSLEKTKQNNEKSIYNAEQAVADAKENLDDNRDELTSQDVSDAYEDLLDTLKATNISLDSILKDSDEIIGVDKEYLNDDFESSLGVKSVNSLSQAQGSYKKARAGAAELDDLAIILNNNSSDTDIDSAAEKASLVLIDFEKHLNDMKVMLNATVTSNSLSESSLNSFISSISSNRSAINTKITALNNKTEAVGDARDNLDDYVTGYEEALQDLANAKADAERDLFNAEASVTSKELALSQAKRDYDDLIAPLTDAEMAAARTRLNSASVSLQKAQNSLNDATLTSPIDGQVVELNYKAGDIIVDNNQPVAVILNNETLFVVVNAEEADVSKLSVGQKAIATFDALDGLQLEGEISFISLTSNTSNNGIVTYEVRVLINNPSSAGKPQSGSDQAGPVNERQIREGMSANIEFVAQEVRDVLIAPVSAIRNVEGKPSAQLVSGEWVPVTTGFTDGKNVEVISGLNAGDKILY